MGKKYVFFVGLLLASYVLLAQDTRNVETKPNTQYQTLQKEKKGLFSFLKKNDKAEYRTNAEEIRDFRARMEKVQRKKAKEEYKMASKGQYSDPSYFGHKRPPKKRPVGKQKFCKVCKIKH